MRGVCGLVLLSLLLGGCAQLRALQQPAHEADSTPAFLLRLVEADRAELEQIGVALEAPAEGPVRPRQALRHALWQSTPGHPGFAAEPARRTLQALVEDEPGLDPDSRTLLRIYLSQLDRRIELQRANRDLAEANRQLQQQIEALTDLEREMNEEGGDGD